jgi:hypothetical protein
MVNLKIIIAIIVGIGIIGIIIGGVIGFNSEKEMEGIPWRAASGPFQIEKYEYYLGEKIFFNAIDIPIDQKGEIIFFRPELDRSNKKIKEIEGIPEELISKKIKYIGIEFNGENKQSFNKFFEPRFSEWNGVCSTKDIVGEWIIVFLGTQYENINFTILNETMPGDTRTFEPIC